MGELAFTDIQLDALREIGNIGAGNAATALSELLGERVQITVPSVQVVEAVHIPDLIGGPDRQVAGIHFALTGDFEGSAMYVFPIEEARFLSDRLLGLAPGTTTDIGEMERSVVGEVGNILTGSYVTSLQQFTGLGSWMSPPGIVVSTAAVVFSEASVIASMQSDWTIWVHTNFVLQDGSFAAYLVLLAAPEAMEKVLSALGVGSP